MTEEEERWQRLIHRLRQGNRTFAELLRCSYPSSTRPSALRSLLAEPEGMYELVEAWVVG